jgi:hypothetical protein
MTNTAKPIVWCGLIAGMTALAGVIGLALFQQESQADPAPVAVEAPVPHAASPADKAVPESEPEPAKPEQPKSVQESEHPITNRTVEDLLAGVMEAREREDRAWLARVIESTAGHAELTWPDWHTAHRQFLWVSVSRLWLRVTAAWNERAYTVSYDGDSARATFEVGGALGQVWFDFVRVGDGWYFQGV